MVGSDYLVIVSGDFGCRECGRIVSSLDLSPKVIQRHSSLCCGLQVAADDDDVLIKRSEYDDDAVLIERSKCDDDDVLIETSEYDDDDVLIERSECDDDDVTDQKIRV